jgi:hypothetical protein
MSTDSELSVPCWLAPSDAENPFGFEVIDCRSIALTMVSATPDPQVVANFFGLRRSDASEVAAKGLSETLAVDCRFAIDYDGGLVDGPIFLAPEMEHKWDIYAHGGKIYVRRSWTGIVVHVAEVEQVEAGRLSLRSLTCETDPVFGVPEFAVAQLHFLLSTYLKRQLRPFPIPPPQAYDDPRDIALGGWSFYGRAAQFACRLDAYRIA